MPQLAAFDPKDKPATQEEIHSRWLELEAAPVVAQGHLVDFDERSEKRMVDTVEQWDSLPEVPGAVVVEEGMKRVRWRMADNTAVPFALSELVAFLQEAKTARAARAAVLFAQAQAFKADPATTQRDLANWGL